jgi:hypothetical protein
MQNAFVDGQLDAAGWLAHAGLGHYGGVADIAARGVAELRGMTADRILVHVASSRGEVVESVLAEVGDYLRAAQAAGRHVEVEIVANSAGLDILRAAYPNLTYVACNQTADRLREQGVLVRLLPGVHVAPTALDEIVRRMQQGWVYIRA